MSVNQTNEVIFNQNPSFVIYHYQHHPFQDNKILIRLKDKSYLETILSDFYSSRGYEVESGKKSEYSDISFKITKNKKWKGYVNANLSKDKSYELTFLFGKNNNSRKEILRRNEKNTFLEYLRQKGISSQDDSNLPDPDARI